MVLWLMLLPWAFMPALGLGTIVLCTIIGYQILGFEDIGVEIESPFGHDYNHLPVDALQAQIFNNLVNCLGDICVSPEAVERRMARLDSRARKADADVDEDPDTLVRAGSASSAGSAGYLASAAAVVGGAGGGAGVGASTDE